MMVTWRETSRRSAMHRVAQELFSALARLPRRDRAQQAVQFVGRDHKSILLVLIQEARAKISHLHRARE